MRGYADNADACSNTLLLLSRDESSVKIKKHVTETMLNLLGGVTTRFLDQLEKARRSKIIIASRKCLARAEAIRQNNQAALRLNRSQEPSMKARPTS
jgi:hypothetical protein